jgi:hypothetical protein
MPQVGGARTLPTHISEAGRSPGMEFPADFQLNVYLNTYIPETHHILDLNTTKPRPF